MSAGYTTGFAIDADGQLWSWGAWTGRSGDYLIPGRVSLPAAAVDAAAGENHCVALTAEGRVWSWGNNAWGQLGVGTTEDENTLRPVRVPGLRRIVQVAAGVLHSAAVDVDGRVWVWGNGEHGELADGGRGYTGTPTLVAGLPAVCDLSIGYYHVLVALRDGTAMGWGLSGDGQLGTGRRATYRRPAVVSGVTDAVAVHGMYARSLLLSTSGRVFTFGSRRLGIYREETSVPRLIREQDLRGVVQVTGGELASYARMKDGTVRAWGNNGRLALGQRGADEVRYPIVVPGLRGVRQLSSSTASAFALV